MFCFFLNNDREYKPHIQIAHLDHNARNSAPDNLAVMCLEHHSAYDSRSRQSTGLTEREARTYKTRLIEYWRSWDAAPHQLVRPPDAADALQTSRSKALRSNGARRTRGAESTVAGVLADDVLARLGAIVSGRGLRNQLNTAGFTSNIVEAPAAAVVEGSIAGREGRLVLKIADETKWNWELLVFERMRGRWRAAGRVALEHQKGYEPIIRYVGASLEGAPSLWIVDSLQGYGTGFFVRGATWFESSGGTLIDHLRYPIDAYDTQLSAMVGVHITGHAERVEARRARRGGARIVFAITYTMLVAHDRAAPSLLANEDVVVDVAWDASAGTYKVVDEARNTFERVEKVVAPSADTLIATRYGQVLNRARSASPIHLNWFDRFLRLAGESPEKAGIVEALEARRAELRHRGRIPGMEGS